MQSVSPPARRITLARHSSSTAIKGRHDLAAALRATEQQQKRVIPKLLSRRTISPALSETEYGSRCTMLLKGRARRRQLLRAIEDRLHGQHQVCLLVVVFVDLPALHRFAGFFVIVLRPNSLIGPSVSVSVRMRR